MKSDKTTILDEIRSNPFFTGMDETDSASLARSAIRRNYQKGEIVTQHGDIWPYFFLIIAGKVNAVKVSYEGRRLLIVTLGEGDLFWGLAFFNDGAPMPVTLEALGSCQIYLWSKDSFYPILMKNPQTMWRLCQSMVNRMSRASEIVEEQAFQSNAGRLARLLLDSFKGSEGLAVARDLTLEEMATRIGTTREIVCRVLYQFSDQKLIQVTRTEFSLTNEGGLRELADY